MGDGTTSSIELESISVKPQITIEPPRPTELVKDENSGARDLNTLSKLPRLLKYFQKNPEMSLILVSAGLGIMTSLAQLGPEWGSVAMTMGSAGFGASRGETLGGKFVGAIGGGLAGAAGSELMDYAVNSSESPAVKAGVGFIDDAVGLPGIIASSEAIKRSSKMQKVKEGLKISKIKSWLNKQK